MSALRFNLSDHEYSWTNWLLDSGLPQHANIPIAEDNIFSNDIAELINNEYEIRGHLPSPQWVRDINRAGEQRIQNAISDEDNREYRQYLQQLNRTSRAIREIRAGRGGGSIATLTNEQNNLRRQIAQMRMNPRVSGRRAREFRSYVRDQS